MWALARLGPSGEQARRGMALEDNILILRVQELRGRYFLVTRGGRRTRQSKKPSCSFIRSSILGGV